MIKKVYIDGLFMALSYEAKKIFIKRDDIDIKFKEGQEEKRIITLLTVLGVHEVIGDYTISIDFEFMVLEIHKKYDFKVLRKLGKDDIEKIWTITMVEIDQLMTKEAKEWIYIRGTMDEVIAKLKELAAQEQANKGVNTNGK